MKRLFKLHHWFKSYYNVIWKISKTILVKNCGNKHFLRFPILKPELDSWEIYSLMNFPFLGFQN